MNKPPTALRWKPLLVWCTAVAAAASGSEAQSVLRGAIRADSTQRYIVGAEISIASLGVVVRSNGAGRYSLQLPPLASYQVVVRAIGYRPLTASLAIDDVDTADVDFVLSRAAIQLPTLRVEAEASRFSSGKMSDFERRRRLGFGTFLDRDQLRRNEDTPLSITLRSLVSIRLVPRPLACGGGFAAASGRGGSFGGAGQQLYCVAVPRYLFAPACYLSIYIDGARVWAWDSAEPPNLDDIVTTSIEGIEVYRGAAELHAELNATGNQCGALLLWTRVGEAS